MGLALNLIALIMVIGLSWIAMLWMSGRFHGERRDFTAEPFGDAADDAAFGELFGDDFARRSNECATCNGSGARKNEGRLAPCPACEGTGVLT